MVEEIRLHGMGGQGVVVAGELIAIAASYEEKFCRAFPMYGSARRGAPVQAFAQIGPEDEATRSMIYYPDYLLVLDPPMPETMDVTSGLKEGGTIIYNTAKNLEEAYKSFNVKISKIGVIDATRIATEVIGRPIPNTSTLGAFIKTTNLLELESLFKAIERRFQGDIAESNKKATKRGYDEVEIGVFEEKA
ncbi:MAG: 2-oxoacid:acceptor oxidoreductase family protein [Candidatus Bathyarchaeia archaeon]